MSSGVLRYTYGCFSLRRRLFGNLLFEFILRELGKVKHITPFKWDYWAGFTLQGEWK